MCKCVLGLNAPRNTSYNLLIIFILTVSVSFYNIIPCQVLVLLLSFCTLFAKILKVVNLSSNSRPENAVSRGITPLKIMHPIALREQRTVLRDNHCNVTRTTCQVAHIFPRGAVPRPFFAIVEHCVACTSWISDYNSAIATNYSTLDT